jgi:hypothetical protein
MAKRVTDPFNEVSIASFYADIISIKGHDVQLRVKSVFGFDGNDVSLKHDFVTVSRDQDFMKQYPQGCVGSHVEGVVTTDFVSPEYKLKHIVYPV